MWRSDELRESFLKFFESKGHLRLPSFSLIPVNDPTLLLIGAGMAPFKPYFRGEEVPPSRRITTCQKCVRVGDIERVGRTARHHTFFEMLGNFSFGDYFKKEAIEWAWEYMTQTLELPAEKLWVSVHTEDDEAFGIWKNSVGVPLKKIIRLEDNFWGPIGQTGPCGPCSEIYFDRGLDHGCGKEECLPGCDCDRFVEVWNLVFTGLNKIESGEFLPLPAPCIDTGLGFERLLMLMQGKNSPYETELFTPLLKALEKMCGKTLGGEADVPLKIVSDHVRALSFMMADGISPSNEGKGYVLRRILRRAARLGRVLGIPGPFLADLSGEVVRTMGSVYPELVERKEYIRTLILREEENFNLTLSQGSAILAEMLENVLKEGGTVLPGADVFKLYDTYGFPWELTAEVAAERGLEIDEEGFREYLGEQKERARADQERRLAAMGGSTLGLSAEPTVFEGYKKLVSNAEIMALILDGGCVSSASAGEEVGIVLDRTPFYGESGGQLGDSGFLEGENLRVAVIDTVKSPEGFFIHRGRILAGSTALGDRVRARVDEKRRLEIMRHHSATHLLQAALRSILGTHVAQAGSLVTPDYFRFDFSHFKALSPEEIRAIEEAVNRRILENISVCTSELSHEEAIGRGALAFFGEKYGATVRLVEMGEVSRELCGGTHVRNTGEIGFFKIVSEGAIASGVRRIEAVAGMSALRFSQQNHDLLKGLSQELKVSAEEVPQAVERLRDKLREGERKILELEKELSVFQAESLLSQAREVDGFRVLSALVPSIPPQALRELGDRLREKMGSGVVVLGTEYEGKAALLAAVTPDLAGKKISAGAIISEIAPLVSGRGGGRPDLAQAGGKNPEGLPAALEKAGEIAGGSR